MEKLSVGAWRCCVGCLFVDDISNLVGRGLVGFYVGWDRGGCWSWDGLGRSVLLLEA